MSTLLQKIDSFFSQKSDFEKLVYYSLIFLMIVFIAYEYILPLSKKKLAQERRAKEAIEQKLNMDKAYIASISRNGDETYLIKQLLKEKKEKKEKLAYLLDEKNYLSIKLKELTPLLYNKKKWASFLDSITAKANKYKIDVEYIANEFIQNTKEFGHVLEIEVDAKGNFKNILAFLNSLEESDLVTDVYEISMKGKSPIQLHLKVSVWGINY
ncbi:type 4a pilus biogenesis protein PilO [Nitratiruptor sp. SB155-2]|uniref:type 4a pilus biogenesis protein PilO n=1 Tax=Nitratiruptor sp. (strain SB155-2) TaxID=387092 RepID=UPI00015872B0|nr:type 4a pilus biogenesis protein PilO [Nitratiruptor sp. SB155-2]BAF70114.1 conserved hypothetical protein [Nitratiruptor sp. SB155-2]